MKIINPIYDYAFKYLMQNNRIAKSVLSVLLDCDVVELVVEQQEIVAVDEARDLKLYRLDFSAIIIDENNKKQRVLIELQKSKLPTNTLRFRTYLGQNYLKREMITNRLGREESKAYPIISIYLLGYNVADIPYLSINIDNKITNTVTKKEVDVSSDFINLLTHKTRIIQIRRLSEKRRTRLEQFLLLFNQSWITTEKYILELQEVPNEFDDIVKYLGIPINDEAFKNKLKGEEEIDEIFRQQEAELAEAKQEKARAKQREAEAKQREAEAKQKEAEAKQREAEAKQKVTETEAKYDAMQLQFAKYLLQTGKTISEIVQLTGLNEETLKEL